MPVTGNPPPALKDALEAMEREVQAFKKNLGFVAPEMQDRHWGQLQVDLAITITNLYEEVTR